MLAVLILLQVADCQVSVFDETPEQKRARLIIEKSLTGKIKGPPEPGESAFIDAIKNTGTALGQKAEQSGNVMGDLLTPMVNLFDKSNVGLQQAQFDTTATADSITTIVEAGENPLNLAKEVLNNQKTQEARQHELMNQVSADAKARPGQLSTASRTTLAVTNTKAANAGSDIAINTKLATDKTDKMMLTDTIQSTKAGTMFTGRYNAYDQSFAQWQPEIEQWVGLLADEVKDTNKQNKELLKYLFKLMVNFRKNMQKAYGHAVKTINTDTWFNKHFEGVKKSQDSLIAKTIQDFNKKIQQKQAKTQAKFSGQETAQRIQTTNFVKAVSQMTKADNTKKQTQDERSTAIGLGMQEEAQRAEGIAKEIEIATKEIQRATATAKVESIAQVTQKDQEGNTIAKARKEQGTAVVDSGAVAVQEELSKSRTRLTSDISEWITEVEQEAQSVLLELVGGISDATQGVTTVIAKGRQIEAGAAELEAKSTAGAVEQKRIMDTSNMLATTDNEEMNRGLNNLAAELQSMGLAFDRKSSFLVEETGSQLRKELLAMPKEPLHHLAKTVRHLETKYEQDKDLQEERLATLGEMQKQVGVLLRRNPGSDDPLLFTEIPAFAKQWRQWQERARQEVGAFKQTISDMEQKQLKLFKNQIKDAWNSENLNNFLMAADVKKLLKKNVYADRALLIKRHDQNKELGAKLQYFKEETQKSMDYLHNLIDGCGEQLTKARNDVTNERTMAQEEIAKVENLKISELRTKGKQEEEAAMGRIKTEMDKTKMADDAGVSDWAEEIGAHQKAEQDKVEAKLEMLGNSVRDSFFKRAAKMDEYLNAQKADFSKIGDDTSTHTEHFKTVMESVKSRTSAMDALSQRLIMEFDRLKSTGEENLAKMKADFEDSLGQEVGAAKRKLAREQQDAQDKLGEEFQAVGAGNTAQRQHRASSFEKSTNAAVKAERDGVTEAERISEKVVSEAEEGIKKVEKNAQYVTDKVKVEGKHGDEDSSEETEALGLSAKETQDTSGAVVGALSKKANDMLDVNDEAMTKLMDNVEGEAQTAISKMKVAKAGVTAQVEKGEGEVTLQMGHLSSTDRELWHLAKGLDEHRQRYEASASDHIGSFKATIKNLQEEMKKDSTYLDNYEAYSLSREMMVIRQSLDLLRNMAKSASGTFNEVLDQEFAFMNQAMKVESSDTFSVFAKIRDADYAIQKGLREDDDFIKRLEDHEKKNEMYWPKVLAAAEAAYDEQDRERKEIDSRNGTGAIQREERNLDGAVGAMMARAQGASQAGEEDQLAASAEDAVTLLAAEKGEGDVETNKTINGLNWIDEQMTESADSDLGHESERIADMKTQTETEGIDATNDMTKMINNMFEFNREKSKEYASAANQKRMEILDKMMTSSLLQIGSSANLSSRLEVRARRNPRLQSLLEENVKLRRLQTGLDERHRQLGSQVQRVKELSQTLVLEPAAPLAAPPLLATAPQIRRASAPPAA